MTHAHHGTHRCMTPRLLLGTALRETIRLLLGIIRQGMTDQEDFLNMTETTGKDMEKETQDLLWACMPNEARDEIRKEYRIVSKNPRLDKYDSVYLTALEGIFGNNLTSDTEPEEMLMISKSKVLGRIKYLYSNPAYIAAHVANAMADELRSIFGDKCLPDKPSNGAIGATPPAVKLDVKQHPTSKEVAELIGVEYDGSLVPKIRKGDKVYFNDSYYKEEMRGKIGRIHAVRTEAEYYVEVDNTIYWAKESDIEPYTEESPNQSQNIANCDKSEDNQLKDNMEEKELNLCELLAYQDLCGTYSPIYGEVRVTDIACDSLVITPEHSSDNNIELFPDGRFGKNGDCLLFPSRALYEKYPLDAHAAWMEWQSERKRKRWRAKLGEKYWVVDIELSPTWSEEKNDGYDKARYNNGNYFRTEESAKRAAKMIKELLENFEHD